MLDRAHLYILTGDVVIMIIKDKEDKVSVGDKWIL